MRLGRVAGIGAAVLACFALLSTNVSGAEAKETTPRFEMPAEGRPGRIYPQRYLGIDDPKEAARQLLKDATLAQVDMDRVWSSEPRSEILLPSGPFVPDKKDLSFFVQATEMVAGDIDTSIVCLIKFKRSLSIKELAGIMNLGIRPYRTLRYYTYVSRVPVGAARTLQDHELVEWVGSYSPQQKLYLAAQKTQSRLFYVFTLVDDMPTCRSSLGRLGATVRSFHSFEGGDGEISTLYTVEMDPGLTERIAGEWWVFSIAQQGELRTQSDSPRDPEPDGSSLVVRPDIRPLDSRKLAGWTKGAKYTGDGDTLMVFDDGCYWQHPEFGTRALGSPHSDPSADVFHGTHVAGIILGRHNTAVKGGGASGMAPRARFSFRTVLNTFWPDMFDDKRKIVNLSVNESLYLFGYGWGAYFTDTFAHSPAHDELVVTSAGNEGNDPIDFVTNPGTAKNALTVGGIRYVETDTSFVPFGSKASYSPTGGSRDDDRLKPDIVAPSGEGDNGVISCKSPSQPSFVYTWDGFYQYSRADSPGTSQATPHVTGAAAVVSEWYRRWRNQFHPYDNAYAPTSQLLRALLINTAIPLRWNGNLDRRFPDSPGDTVATSETRGGFADSEFGFGLVNAYSGVSSTESEYRRVLVWQDRVDLNNTLDKTFSVRSAPIGASRRPRYLVATMAYDDVPGNVGGIDPMRDRLELTLVDPMGNQHDFNPPFPFVAGTVQKIIIPWPTITNGHNWSARVRFATTTSGREFPAQDFAVVVDVIDIAPRLRVLVNEDHVVRIGGDLHIPVTVRNEGGNVAAGVTIRLDDPLHKLVFGSQVDTTHYLGNLSNNFASVTKTFKVSVPMNAQSITLQLKVDAINKMIDGGPYPIRKTINIQTIDIRKIYGRVKMLPGFNQTVQGAQILVNGVPTGSPTDASGNYSVEVPMNFSGVVRPKKGTTHFIPDSKPYANVTQDQPDQHYEAEYHTVSGVIVDENQQGIAGITVVPKPAPGSSLRASPSVVTQSGGSFTIYVEHGWTGKFEPQGNGTYANFTVVNPAHAHHDSIVSNVYSHNIETRRALNWQPGGVHATATAIAADYARIAPDGNGGAVVVWTDDRSPATGTDIWAQRVGIDGTPIWAVNQVPVCTATANQEKPWIERLGDNSFLIVWTDLRNGNRDIYAQRIGSDGQPLWIQNGIAVCQAVGDQQDLRVVHTSDDAVIAVWMDRRNGVPDVFAQKLGANGVNWGANGVGVCVLTGAQKTPAIAADLNGGAYIAWEDERPGVVGSSDIYLQRLDSAGVPTFALNGVWVSTDSPSACHENYMPEVAVTDENGCLVAFLDCNAVRVQKFAPNGQSLWSEARSAGVSHTVNRSISLLDDGNGGAVVAWVGGGNDCANVTLQRLSSSGGRLWGANRTGVLAPVRSDQPRILRADSKSYFVCWRQGIDCPGSSTADVAVQQYDSTGSPMWGRGIVVGGNLREQRNPTIASDLVSGLVACWTDNRVAAEQRVYVARVNGTPQTFLVSGVVRDQAGAGVENLEVRAVDGSDVLVARMSRSDGTFALGVPAFWQGDIQVVPRGYLNTASPPVQTVGPMLASTVRNFTLSHQSTRWQDEGLGIFSDAADVVSPSITTDASGSVVVVWSTDEQVSSSGEDADIHVQRVDRSGDILWTPGGDRVVSLDARDEFAIAVPSNGNDVILLWRRAAEFVGSGGGLWAERYSEPQQGKWEDDGIHLVDDLDISMFSACSDMAGGAFVCWFDESWCWLTRLRNDGTLDWPSAVKLGYAGVSPPIMEPDSVGGVVLSWQYTGGGQNHLYAQRVNSNGQMLWGSGQPGEPLVVRGGFVNMNPGDFRMSVDPFGGALVAWTERSQPTSSDDRIRASWIYHDGTKFSGPAGVELPGAIDQMSISDLALDDPSHFFVLYHERVPGSSVLRLAVRRVEPDIFGGISDFWSASGKTIAAGGIYESRIFGRDPDGGCLVVWRDNHDVNSTRLTAEGNPAWSDRDHRIASDVFGDVLATSDGARGAYVFWRGLTNALYATRVSHAVLPNAEVAISSFVRGTNNISRPISETHANGCPKGDEDDLVFRIELDGDLMESPPASAITLSSPLSASGVKFYRTETADSTLRLNGDHYRTTITVSEFSGCGEDSVEIRINDWVVGHARFNVKSPDIDRSGWVTLSDFSVFGAHFPSTVCNCINPKDYSHCVDFALPDTVVNVQDFAEYASHNDHKFVEGSGMPVAASSSGGDVALRFEEFEQGGQRRLRVAVSLENVQAFSAGFVVLLNENPRLSFAEWRQNSLYPQTTICAPITRDGKSEIALGVLGTKNAPIGSIELGTMDLLVASDASFELTDEDLRLVSGEILDLDGNALAVSGRGRTVGPRRYDNWLAQNYPNPFNPTTTIAFSITKPGHVDLAIYDVRGALVRNLVKGSRKPNLYRVDWDGQSNAGSPVASGVYFYRLRAPGFTSSKKMVLLK